MFATTANVHTWRTIDGFTTKEENHTDILERGWYNGLGTVWYLFLFVRWQRYALILGHEQTSSINFDVTTTTRYMVVHVVCLVILLGPLKNKRLVSPKQCIKRKHSTEHSRQKLTIRSILQRENTLSLGCQEDITYAVLWSPIAKFNVITSVA